eukprot:1162040-Pelagomonas_calceolata.AAC.7
MIMTQPPVLLSANLYAKVPGTLQRTALRARTDTHSYATNQTHTPEKEVVRSSKHRKGSKQEPATAAMQPSGPRADTKW